MFYSDIFSARPAAGIVGRIFISTDTLELYRDNGTTWDQLDAANIGGSLATNQIAYGSATNTIAGSNTLTYNPTTSLLVNNSVTAASLIARGTNLTPTLVASANNDILVGLDVNPTFTNGAFTNVRNWAIRVPNASFLGVGASPLYSFYFSNGETAINAPSNVDGILNFQTGGGNKIRIFTNGNTLIQNGGTFTDNGQRLQVQGTSFFSDIVGIGTAPITGNSLNVASNIVGTFGTGIFQQGQVQSNVTGSSFGFLNTLNIVNTAFTTNSVAFAASQGTIGGSVTLSANTGFLAASSLTTGTNVYGFRGQIASGTNRWNLFMDGTADNYLAGKLFIGGTNGFDKLVVVDSKSSISQYTNVGFLSIVNSDQTNNNWSTIAFTDGETQGYSTAIQTKYTDHTNNYGELHFSTRGSLGLSTKLLITENGNVLLNTTTDGGQRLQVQGTTLLNGNVGVGTAPAANSSIRSLASTTTSTYNQIFLEANIGSSTTNYAGLGIAPITANATFSTFVQHIELIDTLKGAASTITEQYGILIRNLSSGNANYGIFGQVSAGNNKWNLYMNGTANNFMAGRLALGSISAIATRGVSNRLQLTGGSIAVGYELESEIASSVTGEVRGYQTYITQQLGGSLNRLIHYWVSSQSTFGGSITNQYGVFIEAGTIGATNNYGLYSEIPSGSNRWNLYMQGTANNYMAGNLLLKTTTDTGYSAQITGTGDNMLSVWGATAPSIRLDNAASAATRRFVIGLSTATNNFIQGSVSGDACISTASSNPLLFGMWQTSSAAEVMRISTALNLQIGSITDTGEKLQLTGSIRVNGQRSATAGGNSGQHLIINCDGVSYKIALLNP
jgi:hypothetical protein